MTNEDKTFQNEVPNENQNERAARPIPELAPLKRSYGEVDRTGSEFRRDPLTGRWALIAEGRGARPTNLDERAEAAPVAVDVSGERKRVADSFCPFCPGSETMTPRVCLIGERSNAASDVGDGPVEKRDLLGTTFEFREAESDADVEGLRWNVRVFENKFPAFRPGELSASEAAPNGNDLESGELYGAFPGVGKHEVVVDSDRHARGWSDFSDAEITLAFLAFRRRLQALRDSGKYAYSFFFKNVGSDAGASQGHSHCQLTATTLLPPDVRVEVERLLRYDRGRRGRGESADFWDALIDSERRIGSRVVATTKRFVALCPYASRFPMEIEICARRLGAFEDYDDETTAELATFVRDAVFVLESWRRDNEPNSDLSYNVVMRNVPSKLDEPELRDAAGLGRPRWTILPSIVKKAGYEWGSGIYINPTSPETAASRLRAEWVRVAPALKNPRVGGGAR